MTVKTTIVRKGLSNCPENPDDGLLVADGDITPGQNQKKFTVAPEIGPVVFLRAAGLNDEHRFLIVCQR